MDLYSIIFYLFVILFGAFWTITELNGNWVFKIVSRAGAIYMIVFSILKLMKVV